MEVWGTVTSAIGALGPRQIVCDVRSEASVCTALEEARPDGILHLAGQSFVPLSWEDPAGTIQTNVVGTVSLLRGVLRVISRARVVVIGSGLIYGRTDASPCHTEEAAFDPTNPYALSKLCADLMAGLLAQQDGLDVVRVRPLNHTGPGQRPDFALPAFCRQIARAEAGLARPRLEVGNLDVHRDITDVRDIAAAYRMALLHGHRGEVYNVGSGKPVLLRRVVDLLSGMARIPIEIVLDPSRVRHGEPLRYDVDASKFKSHTGWSPQVPLEQTLEDLLSYWRDQASTEILNSEC